MMRKLIRNCSLSPVFPFITILTLLIAATMLAQGTGAGQASGNPYIAPAARDVNAPSQALGRPMLPGGRNAGRAPALSLLPQTSSVGQQAVDTPLFLPPVLYGGVGGPFVIADLNGDGKPDIVGSGFQTVSVLLGNGDGTFQTPMTVNTGLDMCGMAIADLNHDGKLDVVVSNGYTTWGSAFGNSVGVLLGKGDGTLQEPVIYSPVGQSALSVTIADVNGDSHPDLAIADWEGAVTIMLGNGDGSFQAPVGYSTGPWGNLSVVIEDLNGDGRLDLVLDNWFFDEHGLWWDKGAVAVLLGNGKGTFQAPVFYDQGGYGLPAITVTDVNGDGRPDIVTDSCGSQNGVSKCWGPAFVGILLGNGDGTFQPAVTYDAGEASYGGSRVAVGDVNGDGKPDIIRTNGYSRTISVLFGDGDGRFEPPVLYSAGGNLPVDLAISDLSGDKKLDLTVGLIYSTSAVLLNNRALDYNPTTTALAAGPNPGAPLKVVNYTASVSSQNGGLPTGVVTFREQGQVTGTRVSLTNGEAIYPVVYKTAGEHVMQAFYSGDADYDFSDSALLTEYVIGPSKTTLSTSGSPSFVGQPVTFTATVTSTYGEIPDGELVTFYDGTTAIGTRTTAGGVATFTTSLLTGKTHAIKATYSGDSTFKPSTGTVTQVVEKYTTTTTLTSSLNPSNFGLAVTLTATVTPTGPYPLTGTVTFRDGTLAIGTATLSGGVAKVTKPKLAVGTHSITATYVGDASNGKSVSAAITQTVSQASLSMVLASAPNPSTFGKSVHFTAKLTSTGGLPSGQPVTFSYNGATLGTVNVNAYGVATLFTTTLPQGSDVVTAAYAGNVNYSSASATVTQVVN